MCTYEQGKAIEAALISEAGKWDEALKMFPIGAMGLIDDATKRTAEYQEAKRQFDFAFAKQRLFSAEFTKRYKKEILAERAERRAKLMAERNDGQ
ncbi:hypothetical protein FACS1894187_04390 [Synergistales bacterium]|nr:hypothetical protein FACS1894187_04390 [Synergistales bacterium]